MSTPYDPLFARPCTTLDIYRANAKERKRTECQPRGRGTKGAYLWSGDRIAVALSKCMDMRDMNERYSGAYSAFYVLPKERRDALRPHLNTDYDPEFLF